jgi:FAD-linked oxidoreductase
MTSRRNLFLALGALAAAGSGALAYRLLRNREPPSPPALDANGRLLWRNWSGIQHSYPATRWAPLSVDELASKIASQPTPIRAVGAGHSFMPLVSTTGTLITLDGIAGIAGHDLKSHTAVVKGGTRLGELGPALASIGQEMPNLPDINKQSLAGALSTATHGTGKRFKALHGDVRALQLVTAQGEVIDCSAEKRSEVFHADRVGLGAFGIVTQVELVNRPLARVRKRTYIAKLQEAIAQWPTLVEQHRNVEFYAIPFTGLAAIITVDATDLPLRPRGPDQDTAALMDLKTLRDVFGLSNSLRRRMAQSAMLELPPEEAVDQGWKLLSNERPVRFNEMEYHFPLENQMAALQEVMAVIETERPDVFFPIEVRIIEGDDAWLSPFNRIGADQSPPLSGSVAVHAYYQDDYRFLFELIEPIFRRHGGRPHWGKLNSLRQTDFAALYPKWKDAMQVREQLDPQGRLLNEYLQTVVSA